MFHRSKKEPLSGEELQDKINALRFFYLPMDLDTEFYQSKLAAVKKIRLILKNTTQRHLQGSDFTHLLLGSLTLLYYFGMHLKLRQLKKRKCNWRISYQFRKIEKVFHQTMDFLQPERTDLTIQLTLDFFSSVSLWTYEHFARQILEIVLSYAPNRVVLFNPMLTEIHCIIFTDLKSARHRVRVLYKLLSSGDWVIEKQKLLPFMTRLLDFFAYSIAKSNKTLFYKKLQRGFEMCLQRIFERAENHNRLTIITTMLSRFPLENMNEYNVLRFASVLDYAARVYKVDSYGDSFSERFVKYVLQDLIGSSNGLYSLIGIRLLLILFDRQSNAPYLGKPVIYFEFSKAKLKLGKHVSGDKGFIRQHRENIHEYLLMACMKHCHNTDNLTSLFSLICVIVLEVPCGLTAAFAACLMMSIQEFAFNGENLSATCRYWMHAIVVSVMSLVCWVHKAHVLYSYVSAIMWRRAKEAPQLNPPLMTSYNIAHHHVTWNKPTLFFEDWELRYGLWKHFKDLKDINLLTYEALMWILRRKLEVLSCSSHLRKKYTLLSETSRKAQPILQ